MRLRPPQVTARKATNKCSNYMGNLIYSATS